jgi:diamine N-acetyltransferase
MFNIKKATQEDIAIIRNLASATWFETYKDILTTEQADYMFEMMYSADSVRKQMTDEGHHYYIAYANENPVGYVSVYLEKENIYHLSKIYILPDMQKSGLGKLLMLKAFEHARNASNGKNFSVELNVNRNNKAVTFYQKMGMYISRQGDFNIGNGYFMNDYIMRIDF